jgi:hypothetical protein
LTGIRHDLLLKGVFPLFVLHNPLRTPIIPGR